MPELARSVEWRLAEGPVHRSVLLRETVEILGALPGETVVDATVGLGGHSEALLAAIGAGGTLIGIDRDPLALEIARTRLARFGKAFVPVAGDHRRLAEILDDLGVEKVDRILFDLGVSSMQLDDPSRGFSIRADGPLDMRMTPGQGPSAADLLSILSEAEIADILWRYGEERRSRSIAHAIVLERAHRPLRRTAHLAEIVARAAGPGARRFRIHPATRTFQALRIAVNGEIDGLERLICEAVDRLHPAGRLAVIAFHSLEDRAVKHELRRLSDPCVCPPAFPACTCGRVGQLRVVTRRPVRPSAAEETDNPRARSARLRAAEKL